jgi:RNA polymerase sigma-70 factor, ECF subfamily
MADDWKDFQEALVGVLPRLRRFAMTLARRRDAADDLVQATVERALRHWRLFDGGRRLEPWTFKIMQNLWIDVRRSAAVARDSGEEPIDVEGEDGRQIVEGRDELRRAEQAFAALKPEQRAVIALVVLEGMTYAQVAETLGVPIGTVMSRLARARASMATFMSTPVRVPAQIDAPE